MIVSKKDLSIIVIGGLNTDIVAVGARKLLKAGEYTYASELKIGPGGKSRNIAQMTAMLSGKNKVAMVGKTSKDPYGLWKIPILALKKAKVNTDFVTITSFKESGQFSGIALIPVDKQGKNFMGTYNKKLVDLSLQANEMSVAIPRQKRLLRRPDSIGTLRNDNYQEN